MCLVGITDYWSGHERPCGYKGCPERAVAEAPRVRNVCVRHAARAGSAMKGKTVAEYVALRLEERPKLFELLALEPRQ